MELTTAIEFNNTEFDKIELVIGSLKSEGWEIYDTKEHKFKLTNGIEEIEAVKYFLKRKF